MFKHLIALFSTLFLNWHIIIRPRICNLFSFFDKEDKIEKQNEILKNYKYLPHTNELLDGVSQFVFDKDSSGIVFGQLLSIMNSRSNNKKRIPTNRYQTVSLRI